MQNAHVFVQCLFYYDYFMLLQLLMEIEMFTGFLDSVLNRCAGKKPSTPGR